MIVGCKKPKGYVNTYLLFNSPASAQSYIDKEKRAFYTNKSRELNFPFNSKTMINKIKRARPPKFLFTRCGSQVYLWKKIGTGDMQ